MYGYYFSFLVEFSLSASVLLIVFLLSFFTRNKFTDMDPHLSIYVVDLRKITLNLDNLCIIYAFRIAQEASPILKRSFYRKSRY